MIPAAQAVSLVTSASLDREGDGFSHRTCTPFFRHTDGATRWRTDIHVGNYGITEHVSKVSSRRASNSRRKISAQTAFHPGQTHSSTSLRLASTRARNGQYLACLLRL